MAERTLVEKADSFGAGLRLIGILVAVLGVLGGLAVIVAHSGPAVGLRVGVIVGASIMAGSLLVAAALVWFAHVLIVLAAIWHRVAGDPLE